MARPSRSEREIHLPPHALVRAAGINPRLLAGIDQTPTWFLLGVRRIGGKGLPNVYRRTDIEATDTLSWPMEIPPWVTEVRAYYHCRGYNIRGTVTVSPILVVPEGRADHAKGHYSPADLYTDWSCDDGTSR